MREAAERRLMQGAEVFILPMPKLGRDDKAGADDFVKQRGIVEFRKLLKEAKPADAQEFVSWGKDGVSLKLDTRPIGERKWLEKKPPPQEYTWEGYMPRRTVGLLVAQGGAGKTFLAMRLAQSIASGSDFLGLATRKGKVVHIACEEGDEHLWRRNHRLHEFNLRDASETERKRVAALVNVNLYPISVAGQELHLVATRDFNIIQTRALETLIYELKRIGGVELLILDPLSRLHSLPDETQAWGTAVINACERIAQEVGCSVLVTHHTGKTTSRTTLYAARGASALADAARLVLVLKIADKDDCDGIVNIAPDDVEAERVLRLYHSKPSHTERQQDIWLRREQGGVLTMFEVKGGKLVLLRNALDWWMKNDRPPIFASTVKEHFKEMFGNKVSRRKADEIIKYGVRRGYLRAIPNAKGKGVAHEFTEQFEKEYAS